MNVVSSKAFARAGLLGNPSDAYNGKAISFSVRDYWAEVTLSDLQSAKFVPSPSNSFRIDSFTEFMVQDRKPESPGGIGLLESATMQFVTYCKQLERQSFRPFNASFISTIPFQVGLAGSSAIVVAMLRSLCRWHDITIKPNVIASMALQAEKCIGIEAGLQDRVIQAYEGLVFMDFDSNTMRSNCGFEFGNYQPMDVNKLSNLYIAFAADSSESTNVLHDDLRQKFESQDRQTIENLNRIAMLAVDGKTAIESGDMNKLSRLIDENFDLRNTICKLNPTHVQMVEVARSCGASAKYCGSGGAIVGVFPDQKTWSKLSRFLSEIGCTVFQPKISDDHAVKSLD